MHDTHDRARTSDAPARTSDAEAVLLLHDSLQEVLSLYLSLSPDTAHFHAVQKAYRALGLRPGLPLTSVYGAHVASMEAPVALAAEALTQAGALREHAERAVRSGALPVETARLGVSPRWAWLEDRERTVLAAIGTAALAGLPTARLEIERAWLRSVRRLTEAGTTPHDADFGGHLLGKPPPGLPTALTPVEARAVEDAAEFRRALDEPCHSDAGPQDIVNGVVPEPWYDGPGPDGAPHLAPLRGTARQWQRLYESVLGEPPTPEMKRSTCPGDAPGGPGVGSGSDGGPGNG